MRDGVFESASLSVPWHSEAMARPKRDELAIARAVDALQEADEQELAFTTSYLAQVSLPYRNPGDIPAWHRKNGNLLLTVRPGYQADPVTGEPRSIGYPSGVIPRQLMFWIITEAKRTRSRELVLGNGVVEFLRVLNPNTRATGGETGSLRRLRTQTDRLLNASISVRWEPKAGDRKEGAPAAWTKNLTVADQVLLWGDDDPKDKRAIVQLSTRFYDELLERAVPLDLGALRLFGDNAWCIDIYAWLTYRFHSLQRPITVPWEELNSHFGTARVLDTKEARYKFKKQIEKHLARVLAVYRDANVESTAAGLKLSPSLTHVRFRGLRALEGGGGEQLTLEAG